MSASVPATTPTTFGTATGPQHGVASRLTAGFLFVTTGLVLASAVLGLSVASAIIARGSVIADPSDVAMIHGPDAVVRAVRRGRRRAT